MCTADATVDAGSSRELVDPFEPMARCLVAYLDGSHEATTEVYFEDGQFDPLSAADLLRADGFFEVDQLALSLVQGRVLDVGAGGGSHSLWLQTRGHEVVALDTSELVREVLERRGVEQVICEDLFALAARGATQRPRFETLLFSMNGLGIAGTVSALESLLRASRSLVTSGGVLIADTSDLRLSPAPDEPARIARRVGAGRGPGEAVMRMRYRQFEGRQFSWLYVDPATLADVARRTGWLSQVLFDDGAGGYLVRLRAV